MKSKYADGRGWEPPWPELGLVAVVGLAWSGKGLGCVPFNINLHPLQNLDIIQLQLQALGRNHPTPISPDLLPTAQELLPVSRRAGGGL